MKFRNSEYRTRSDIFVKQISCPEDFLILFWLNYDKLIANWKQNDCATILESERRNILTGIIFEAIFLALSSLDIVNCSDISAGFHAEQLDSNGYCCEAVGECYDDVGRSASGVHSGLIKTSCLAAIVIIDGVGNSSHWWYYFGHNWIQLQPANPLKVSGIGKPLCCFSFHSQKKQKIVLFPVYRIVKLSFWGLNIIYNI